MTGFLLSDAELHGLIDGQIEVHHRADILRRAAASPVDRERIGSWQAQCDLIRSAFQGIDREPMPSTLDLRAPARLHVVGEARVAADDAPPLVAARKRRSRLPMPLLAGVVAALGLGATWLAGGFTMGRLEPSTAEESLARRAAGEPVGDAGGATLPTMPTTIIPDLTTLGYALVGVDLQAGEPASLLFHYRNASAEQITLGVARPAVPLAAPAAPVAPTGAQAEALPAAAGDASRAAAVGKALVWHVADRTYALAGSLRSEELRALLPAVRGLALDE